MAWRAHAVAAEPHSPCPGNDQQAACFICRRNVPMTRNVALGAVLVVFIATSLLMHSCRQLRYSPLFHPDIAQRQVRSDG